MEAASPEALFTIPPAFPAAYRGNFFFGDCNTGRIERVTIDAGTNTVTSVEHWAEGVASAVDIALGPDGALYYVGHTSQAVYRASHQATSAGLVVSPTNLWMAEGQPAVVMVQLAVNPNQDVTVSAMAAGTDADIGVLSGAMLTFTSANWSTPQPVTVQAGHDLDSTDDLGMVTLGASGLPAETVTVHARDENRIALRISAVTAGSRRGKYRQLHGGAVGGALAGCRRHCQPGQRRRRHHRLGRQRPDLHARHLVDTSDGHGRRRRRPGLRR